MTPERESAAERERRRRTRVVGGPMTWCDAPPRLYQAIVKYLDGGPVPKGYESMDGAMK